MPSILLRPRAKADLGEIWGYIADDSETRADAFIVAIEQKLRLLARQPSIVGNAKSWPQDFAASLWADM